MNEKSFSDKAWVGGFALAVVIGGVAMVFILGNATPKGAGTGILLGATPGLIFGAIGLWKRRTAFGLGMLTAAAVLLILGGICGAISIS